MSKSYPKTKYYKGCIIRQRNRRYQVEINKKDENGIQRIRKAFKTMAEAETYCAQHEVQRDNYGIIATLLKPDESADARAALDQLQGKATLNEAAKYWLKHNAKPVRVCTIKELLDEYYANKVKANRRPATLREIREIIGKFADRYPQKTVGDVTMADILAWLRRSTKTAKHWNKCRRVLSAFFKYAVHADVIDDNPARKIDNATEEGKDVEIYTAAEAQRIMNAVHQHYPQLIAWIATGFFAGLRPGELEGLDWSSVDMDRRHIKVVPETGKGRHKRYVSISDNLFAWLQICKDRTGKVLPSGTNLRKIRKKIVKHAEVSRWLFDGVRHSFGSMHFAMHNNANLTAAEMGHHTTGMLFKHYRELVTPQDARLYWAIMPPVADKK